MDLTTLQNRCLAQLGLSDASGIDGAIARVTEALNFWWRWELPNRIEGLATFGQVAITVAADEWLIDLDEHADLANVLRTLTGPIFIGDVQIDLYSDVEDYYNNVTNITNHDQGTPTTCLRYGTNLRLDPAPSGSTSIVMFGHLYNAALESGGITSEQKSRAVYLGAAVELAHEMDMGEDAQRIGAMLQGALDQLSKRYTLFAESSPMHSSPQVRDL